MASKTCDLRRFQILTDTQLFRKYRSLLNLRFLALNLRFCKLFQVDSHKILEKQRIRKQKLLILSFLSNQKILFRKILINVVYKIPLLLGIRSCHLGVYRK
jgi:hypothetical protein